MIFKIKTDLKSVPDLTLAHLKNKKFYESKDILALFPKNPYWFKIIDGKKGIGKTYAIIEKIKGYIKKDIKFMLGRYSQKNITALGKALNESNSQWPIIMKNSELYCKETNKHVGKLFYLKGKGLDQFTSIQFPEYGAIIVDEYSPTFDGNMTASEITNSLAVVDNFIRFCSDVQRDKPELEAWLYGNNNNEFNIFKQYFGVDFRHKIMIDKEAGLCIINLKELYMGVSQDTNAFGLLKYNKRLKEFFTKNESGKLTDDIMPIGLFDGLTLNYQIVYNNYVYHILQAHDDYFAIKRNDALHLNVPHYALLLRDVTVDINTKMLPRKDTKLIVLVRKLIDNKLVYDSPETKQTIALLMQETYRHYEQEYLLFWDKDN